MQSSQRSSAKRILSLILLLTFFVPLQLLAETAESIKSKIADTASGIPALTEEIAKIGKELDNLGNQADTLANTLKTLDLTKKKLEADIKLTQKKIDNKNVEIAGLTTKISDTGDTIDFNRKIVSKSFASMNELEDQSLIESLLSSDSVSTALDAVDNVATLQTELRDRINTLKSKKTSLETNKKTSEKAKAELVALSKQLSDQKKVVQSTTNEKTALLKETKDSEASYQKLLASRKAQKEALEREVAALEEALRITIDPNSIPSVGSGILKYPLNNIRITQYFGNTEFATKNPQVYKGSKGEHNGIDFAASVGTVVRASASGIVTNVINTSSSMKCGYGNWISIKHPNGLTTLYAHMNLNSVSVGSTVSTGQMIGYSGNSGYTTGPHLHFGVYVTKGLQVTKSVSCPGITIPYAPLNAYLNPLSYL